MGGWEKVYNVCNNGRLQIYFNNIQNPRARIYKYRIYLGNECKFFSARACDSIKRHVTRKVKEEDGLNRVLKTICCYLSRILYSFVISVKTR